MQKEKAKVLDIGEIPEVVEVVDALDSLKDFKEEHVEVFEQLQQLTERYNAAIEAAEKVCRARAVSCGPYDLYQFSMKYDATMLYNLVGHETFLKLGGKISTATVYTLDKTRFEASIAQKLVADDVVEAVRTKTANFHKPDPMVVP